MNDQRQNVCRNVGIKGFSTGREFPARLAMRVLTRQIEQFLVQSKVTADFLSLFVSVLKDDQDCAGGLFMR
jgi:hypothetical protein